MPPMHQNYSIFLDLNASSASELFHILDLNASNASQLFHIIGPQCLQCITTIPYFGLQCLQCIRAIPYFGPRGTATTAAAAAAATAAAAAVSQELWNLGGALVQRAQEQNIPCGESLTSTNRPPKGDRSEWFGRFDRVFTRKNTCLAPKCNEKMQTLISFISTRRDGSNETVRSSRFRSRSQNHYIFKFKIEFWILAPLSNFTLPL